MKIMILEDTPSAKDTILQSIDVARNLKPATTISVIECSSIYQANEVIKEHEDIQLIITDLNMPMRGLRKELRSQTQNGFLTGWVWFVDKVSQNPKFKKTNIIVFSEYIGLLKNTYGNEEHLNRRYGGKKRKIALISKLGYEKDCIIKTLGHKISDFMEAK